MGSQFPNRLESHKLLWILRNIFNFIGLLSAERGAERTVKGKKIQDLMVLLESPNGATSNYLHDEN